MIAEQLQAARAAHWRQQDPLLTLDDAQSWLRQHPLCLYLPRRAQLPAPAPSFVEACLGKPQTMPGAEAIEQAQSLLTRLTASAAVVPLNLLGTVGEQPDFLATQEALPSVLSLRADADWKHAPQKSSGHKVSPLVLELWKLLEQQGALTAIEAREALGRELTEAAVLRALAELWQGLRISPVYGENGQPARWEMMRVRHREALTTAGKTGQVTAISLLVSMYLQSVFAATSEEIEIFLSPVTSRSRVREAVRGLSATRQIHSLSMDAQTYYFLENGLPEFAAVTVAVAVEPAEPPVERPKRREHPLSPPPGAVAPAALPRPVRPKPAAAPSGWKSPQRPEARPRAAARPGGFARAGAPARPRPGSGGEGRPPFQSKSGPRSGPPRRDAAGDPKPFRPKTTEGASPRPGGFARAGAPSRPSGGGGRPAGGVRPPFQSRSGPPRSGAAAGPRPWRPKITADPSAPLRSGRDDKERAARPGGGRGRPSSGGRPPFKPRSGPPRSGPAGDPRAFRPKTTEGASPRPGGFARAGAPSRPSGGGGGRPPFKPRSGPPRSASAGEPRPFRPKTTKSASARPGGFARAGAPPRTGGGGAGRPPFKPRSGPPRGAAAGDPRPWRPKTTADPSAPLRSGRDDKGRAARPSGGGGRPVSGGRPPFKPRSGPAKAGGRPPFKPRSGPPKGGPRSGGKGPGDYPRRKPDRKKPGA